VKRYLNKKVLVTGGTGFIGTRLAERLALEEGADVCVLVNNWFNAASVCRSDVMLIQGSVEEPQTLNEAMESVDIVFHCVGVGGDKDHCTRINVEGTRNVLEAAEGAGVERIVNLSTVGVYGPTITDGMDETAPVRRLGTPYGDSKIEADEVFMEFLKNSRIKGTTIIPTYVWGPRSRWFTVGPVMDMVNSSFYMVDDGAGACNAVHVDNVVDLMLVAGLRDKALGEAFLITDGTDISWREFFSSYAQIAGKDVMRFPSVYSKDELSGFKPMTSLRNMSRGLHRSFNAIYRGLFTTLGGDVFKPLRAPFWAVNLFFQKWADYMDRVTPEIYSWWELKKFSSPGHLNIDKAKRLLGYEPRVSIEEGMKGCEAWLRDQNYLPSSSGTDDRRAL
jgi:nucleoside-diphosphate-sugar epimerase